MADHDWRLSLLAHTSDTAREAIAYIAELERAVEADRPILDWFASVELRGPTARRADSSTVVLDVPLGIIRAGQRAASVLATPEAGHVG